MTRQESEQKRNELIKLIAQYMNAGMKKGDACVKAGVHSARYSDWKHMIEPLLTKQTDNTDPIVVEYKPTPRTYTPRKTTKSNKVFVIVTEIDSLQSVIEGLR